MKESTVRAGVRKYLKQLKTNGVPIEYAAMHGNIYSCGEPDIIGCIYGRMFAIELKAPGNKSTELQTARQDAWERAGALVLRDITSWRQVEQAFTDLGWGEATL